jgi:predicted dehydrogenase
MADPKIKVGVVGLGMGQAHLKSYTQHPQAEITALCDVNKEALARVGKEQNIKALYTDAEEMFRKAGLDAVSIAVPNTFHAPFTLAALQRGLHVLCEKPMAMSVAEAQTMLAAAQKAKKNLMINHSFRFTPVSFALKQQIDAGVIGDIYYGRSVWHRRRGIPGVSWPNMGNWFSTKKMSGGGPLIDLGVHRLDLALWLMGYPEPIVVTGSTYNKIAAGLAKKNSRVYDVEDVACGLIKFANGATLILEASWALNLGENEHMVTSLYGTKGGAEQHNLKQGYEFAAEIYTEEGGCLFTKKLDRTTVNVPSSYHEFINSILEKRAPVSTAAEGIKVMKILEGIYKSAETGREVRYDK